MRPWERSVIESWLYSVPARSTMMPIMVQLGTMLAWRKVKSKDLAEHVGITEANRSLPKQGKGKGVRFDTLEKICVYLNCQPGDLLAHEIGEE